MKTKIAITTAAVALASFTIGNVAAQVEAKLNEQTLTNLSTAMHGEAFAYVKYTLFAESARKSGDPKPALLLEQTAKTERFEHFAEGAKLAGTVGSNADNLKDAIKGENYETTTMYREFAEQAEKASDHVVAVRFEEILQEEMKHQDAFTAALAKLETTGAKKQYGSAS